MAGSPPPSRPLRAPQGWATVPLLLCLLLSLAAQGYCSRRISLEGLLHAAEDPFHAQTTLVNLTFCGFSAAPAFKCAKVQLGGGYCTWYRADYYETGYFPPSTKEEKLHLQAVEPVSLSPGCPTLSATIRDCQSVCEGFGVVLPDAALNTTVTCFNASFADKSLVASYSYTPKGSSTRIWGTCTPGSANPGRPPTGLPLVGDLNVSAAPPSECKAACGHEIDLSGYAKDPCLKVSDLGCSIYSTVSSSQYSGVVCVDHRNHSACPNITLEDLTRCQPGCGPEDKAGSVCLPPLCMGGVRKSAYVHVADSGGQLQYGECDLGSCYAQEQGTSSDGAPLTPEDGASLASYLDTAINGGALPFPVNLPANLSLDNLTNLLTNFSDYLPANLPLNVSTAPMSECEDACGKKVDLSGFGGGMCTKFTALTCSVYSVSASGKLKGAVCIDPSSASACPKISLQEVGRCQPGCGPNGEAGGFCLPTVCASGMKTSAYISVGASGDQLQFGTCMLGFCASPQPGVGSPFGAPRTSMPPAEPSTSPMTPAEPSPTLMPPYPAAPTAPAPAEPPPTLLTPDAAPPSDPTPAVPPTALTDSLGPAMADLPPLPKGATKTAVSNAVKWLVSSCIVLLL